MPTDISTILRLSVPLIVQVGQRRMAVDDVLALGPGAILELEKTSEDDLDLLVNNVPMGRGVAVKVGENFGIKITSIGSPHQRVAALGGQAPESLADRIPKRPYEAFLSEWKQRGQAATSKD